MPKTYATPTILLLGVFHVLLVAYFSDETAVVLGGLLLSSLIIIWLMGCKKSHIKAFLLFSLLGFLAEAVPVWFGVWSYTTEHVLGMPYWLPPLWGVTLLTFIHIYEKYLS